MGISELTLRLILVFVPGFICYIIIMSENNEKKVKEIKRINKGGYNPKPSTPRPSEPPKAHDTKSNGKEKNKNDK